MVWQRYIQVAGLWSLWCFLHSFLISHTVTRWARARLRERFALWRIVFNTFSLVTLVPLLVWQAGLEERVLFDWPVGWKIAQVVMILAGAYLLWAGARVYDLGYVSGIRQMGEYRRRQPQARMDFRTSGILNHIRHPWYSAAIVLIWAWGDFTDIRLVMKTVLVVYVLIGTWLEEKKLLAEIGPDYAAYRERVGMLVPRIWPRGQGG